VAGLVEVGAGARAGLEAKGRGEAERRRRLGEGVAAEAEHGDGGSDGENGFTHGFLPGWRAGRMAGNWGEGKTGPGVPPRPNEKGRARRPAPAFSQAGLTSSGRATSSSRTSCSWTCSS